MTRKPWARFFAIVASMSVVTFTTACCQADVRAAVVLPQQFSPTSDGVKFAFRAGGLGSLCTTLGAGYFMTRVDMPPGAVIAGLEAEFDGTTEDAFGVVSLFRSAENSRDFLAMTPMSLPQAVRGVVRVELQQPEIVREGFQYWLHLTVTGPGVCLRTARVLYHPLRPDAGGPK